MANQYEKQMGRSAMIGMSIGAIGMLIGLVATYMEDIGAGVFFTVMILGVGFFVWHSTAKLLADLERIRKNGEPAEATILSIEENGTSMKFGGAVPKAGVTIQCEVQPKGKPTYQAQTKTYISVLEVAKYQPGSVIQVKFDPKNPQKVAIVE